MRKVLLTLFAAVLALLPVAVPAQYGQRPLDRRMVAEAQRDHPQLVQEYGGEELGHRGAYVDAVGQRIAGPSGIDNANSDLNFTLLNSAVENAFALPGGQVYVTRQLMVLMDNEAELAFALAHEVGHVAARHAQQRERMARRNSISGVLAAIFGSYIGGGLGNAVAQWAMRDAVLSTLSFSREQEYESDTLGMAFMIRAGYDPAAAAGILHALTRNSALEQRIQGRDSRQLPEWASTHPLSQNRQREALNRARASGRLGTGTLNRDRFLERLDGMYVDDDPEQGVIDGRTFTHPDYRIQFTVPPGYLMQNSTRAVSVSGSGGKAQFGGGRYSGSLETYIGAVIRELVGDRRVAIPQPRRTVINGIPAAYTTTRVRTSSRVVDIGVVAYQWAPGTVYRFITLTSAGAGIGPFTPLVQSIRKITPAEAAAIRPRVVDIVTVGPGDSVQSLAARMAYRDFRLERFLALNRLNPGARLVPGQKVKLIVYGNRVIA